MVSTMLVDILKNVFDVEGVWTGPNAFRIYSAVIQLGFVWPVSSLKRMKDFLGITIIQILVIL